MPPSIDLSIDPSIARLIYPTDLAIYTWQELVGSLLGFRNIKNTRAKMSRVRLEPILSAGQMEPFQILTFGNKFARQ